MLTFFSHRFKDEILSNLIFKTKSNGIMFDGDFILKIMLKKSEYLRGSSSSSLPRIKKRLIIISHTTIVMITMLLCLPSLPCLLFEIYFFLLFHIFFPLQFFSFTVRDEFGFGVVVLTQDAHPHNHSSFAENNPGSQEFSTITISGPDDSSLRQVVRSLRDGEKDSHLWVYIDG